MKSISILLFTFIASFTFAQESICPNVEGAIEHPLLQNYANSCIVGYNETKFDAITLPVSITTSAGADKEITVEGKVIDLLYGIENPENTSILEIQRNYEQALKSSGLEIKFSAFGKKQISSNSSIRSKYPTIGGTGILGTLEHLKHKDYRLVFNYLGRNADNELAYFVAQGNKNGVDYTLMLFINHCKGNGTVINGKTFIHAKIIESAVMETGQVTVASMEDNIKNEGKEVFHSILFDFGSANLTVESYATIEILAEYLKSNSDQKYYIVGHTDNVGSLATNQGLSENRAKAVLSALTSKYGVSAAQISAHGVGQLSPLSINETEEGRALNRRVEIVLQ